MGWRVGLVCLMCVLYSMGELWVFVFSLCVLLLGLFPCLACGLAVAGGVCVDCIRCCLWFWLLL